MKGQPTARRHCRCPRAGHVDGCQRTSMAREAGWTPLFTALGKIRSRQRAARKPRHMAGRMS